MKRLSSEFYRGQSFVHWNMTVADRRTGWLDEAFHSRFREVLLHTLSRFELLCPVYCLMPDHLHLLWLGLADASDQDKATAFLRRHLNACFKPDGFELQKQSWDVVLREKDRERHAVVKTIFYIVENPARRGLAGTAREWPFSGSQAVGYPQFDWRDANYGEKVWRIYEKEVLRRVAGMRQVDKSEPSSERNR
jgi:putative transposase